MKIWLDRNLIRAPLYYGLCTTEAMFRRELKRHNVLRDRWPNFILNGHSDATTHYFTQKNETCAIVCIRARSENTGIQIAALLVHEAVHIWQEVKTLIGESSPSLEFEAYSIQAIAQELMEAYVEQTKSSKK